MGYRWRRMYYATGLPGWLRFGYSPGWVGRSPTGLPPTAEWLMASGQMPQYLQYLGTTTTGIPQTFTPQASMPPFGAPLTKEQEKQMLEQQVTAIESQLEAIRKRLEDVRKNPTTSQSQQTQQYYPIPPFGYPPMPYSEPTPEEELASLEDYRKNLGEEVKGVEARIEDLKKLIKQSKT